jgi:hypothetical protein
MWLMKRFCDLATFARDGFLLRAGLYFVIGPLFVLSSSCKPPEANTSAASPTPTSSVSPSSPQSEAVQQNLAAAFAASQAVLFEAKTPADLLKFTPLQQVQLAQDPAGVAITASGNDPSLFVPAFPAKACLVKIGITAPANGVIQIFYLVGSQTTYNEQNSTVQPLRAGDNTVYLKIDAPETTGQWRFDPGSASGKYILKGFEVRAAAP